MIDVESELKQIEKTIRGKRHGEADKGWYLREYERCESALQSIIERNGESPRAIRLAAELAMKRRQWEAAAERWRRWIALVGDTDADSVMQLSIACREAGRFDESEQALKLARQRGLNEKLLQREEKRLRQQLGESREQDLGRRALRGLFGESGEDAIAIYSEILEERQVPAACREHLAPLIADLARLARAIQPPRTRPLYKKWHRLTRFLPHLLPSRINAEVFRSPMQVIFSCGFGFSGSGAVTDFLRDFDGCELPFGGGELSWFKGNERTGWTGADQLIEYVGVCREEYHWHVVNFFLTSFLGVHGLVTFDGEVTLSSGRLALVQRQAKRAILNLWLSSEADIRELVMLGRGLFEGLVSAAHSANVEELFRDFFRRLIESRFPPEAGERCVFDNSIKAYELELLRLMPQAQAIVTRRDPRDQFVARAYESGNGGLSVQEFVRSFQRRERGCRMALLDPRIRRAVHELQFEEFVLEPSSRDRLCGDLGLPKPEEEYGNLGKSRQNIGIHKHWPNRKDILYIEKKLRKYLVEAAD